MFNIGPAELLVVLVIALLVLGPSKLPDAARQVGRALGEMRKLSSGFQAEMRDALKEPVEGKPTTSSASSSKSTSSSKSASDDTATGGSLSAPRPPGDTTVTSPAAVGDESGFVSPGDAGDDDDDTIASAEALAKVEAAEAAHMAAVRGEAGPAGEGDPHASTVVAGDGTAVTPSGAEHAGADAQPGPRGASPN